MHLVDGREHCVGLISRSEHDRLEPAPGVREALERGGPGGGVLARADVVERVQRADAERALPVEEADCPLFVHTPQHRGRAREIALLAHVSPPATTSGTSVARASAVRASSSSSGKTESGVKASEWAKRASSSPMTLGSAVSSAPSACSRAACAAM